MLFARCSKIVTLPTPWCTNILVPILSDLYIYFKHHFISFLPNKSYNWRFISISINSLKLRMKYRCNKHSETSLLENVPGCERAKCGTIWSFVSRKRNRRRSQSQRTNRMESCPLPLRTSSSEPSWVFPLHGSTPSIIPRPLPNRQANGTLPVQWTSQHCQNTSEVSTEAWSIDSVNRLSSLDLDNDEGYLLSPGVPYPMPELCYQACEEARGEKPT